MRHLALLILALPLAAQTTVSLVTPGPPRKTVTGYTSTTPAQITFAEAHGWSPGQRIWCWGNRGAPQLRGYMEVKAVVNPQAITVRADGGGADIPGSTGSPIDIANLPAGTQVGYCGAVANYTLRTPAGRIPPVGSVAYARMMSLTSTPWYTGDFTARNNSRSTDGCDGITPALCSTEEYFVVTGGSVANGWLYGYDVANLAYGALISNSTRWRNSALYFIRQFGRQEIGDRDSFNSWTGAHLSSEGDDIAVPADNASFAFYGIAEAYALLRSYLSPAERTRFVNLLWNDPTTNCVNAVPALTGWITAVGGGVYEVHDASSLNVGDILYINASASQYRVDRGNLTSIVTTGTSGTISFPAGVPLPRPISTTTSTRVRISNSGIAGLDGWHVGTIGTDVVTFSTTAPAGTYSAPAMEVSAPGKAGDVLNRGFARVEAVDTAANPDRVTLTLGVGMPIMHGAPWGKLTLPVSDNHCGAYWFSQLHESHHFPRDVRTGTPGAAGTATQNTLVFSAASWPEFSDLIPPYRLRIGKELVDVTSVNAGTRTATVERGADWTAPDTWTVNTLMSYNASVGAHANKQSVETTVLMGKWSENKMMSHVSPLITAAAATAGDHPVAKAMLEYLWNLYTTVYWDTHRASFSGPNFAGLVNAGYTFGRWGTFLNQLQMVGLNSFTTPLDLRFTGSRNLLDFHLRLILPGAQNSMLVYGDSGVTRIVSEEEDDYAAARYSGLYLWPDDPGTQAANDHWRKELVTRGSPYTGTSNDLAEGFVNRLISGIDDPGMTFAAWDSRPRAATFVSTDVDIDGHQNAAIQARQVWKGNGAVLTALNLYGGDHNGSYPGPMKVIGGYGPVISLGGMISAGPGGNDTRNQFTTRLWSASTPAATAAGVSAAQSSPTLRISGTAPTGGGYIQMTSDSTWIAVPRWITVPAGQSTVAGAALHYQNPNAQTANITLTGATTVQTHLRAGAAAGSLAPTPQALASVTATGPLLAGHYLVGTVTLSAPAPAGGVSVTVTSDNPDVVISPSAIRIKAASGTSLFFLSASPTATGTVTLTATSANSVQSSAITITPASPAPASPIYYTHESGDVAAGGMYSTQLYTSTMLRHRAWDDAAYGRGTKIDAYQNTHGVTNQRTDVLFWTPSTGRAYAFVYDRFAKTILGSQVVKNIPLDCMTNLDGATPQSPFCTYSTTGNRFTSESAQYGIETHVTSVIPSDPTVRWRRTSTLAQADVVSGGTGGDIEFFHVAQPSPAGTGATTWTLIPSTSTYRAIQSDAGAPACVIAAFNRNEGAVGGINLQPSPYTGNCDYLITGLTAQQPYTLYSVACGGTPILTDEQVGPDGTLRFQTEHCASLSITSTGGAPLEITTASLPQGTISVPYSAQLTAVGGTAPYTWSLDGSSPALPAGLTLSPSGAITGTPTASGTVNTVFRVDDSAGGNVANAISITIGTGATALSVTTSSLTQGTVGQAYSATLAASGGTPPYTWAITSGSLPSGLSLAGATISGIPSVDGSFPITVQVTDAALATASRALTLVVASSGGGGPEPGNLTVRVVQAGMTAAILQVRDASLRGACDWEVEGGNQTRSGTVDGPAARTWVVSGLTAGTDYTATVTCATLAGTAQFTTRQAAGTGPLVFRARPGIGSQVRASYSIGGGPAQGEQIQACSSGCSFTWTGLARGDLVQVTYVALDGGGQALTAPATIGMVVP